MTAGGQGITEVTSNGPNIRARAAFHIDVNVDAGFGATDPQDVYPRNLDRARRQFHVLAAADSGTLDGGRLANYRKLRRELDFTLRRDDPSVARENRKLWKGRAKAARQLRRERGH